VASITFRIHRLDQLTDPQRCEILSLVRAATLQDTVAPFSEQVLLAVRDESGAARPDSHLIAYAGTHLVGCAHHAADSAELVVDPAHRRRGVGTALVLALEEATAAATSGDRSGTQHVWSHGDLPGARAFGVRRGYSMTRELWQMRRSLGPESPELPEVTLPEGFMARRFVVGQDEDAWLRLNAAAFVNHPEQGRMTRHDLAQRINEPWFDSPGLILIEDMRGSTPRLAASHWTKVAPAEQPGTRPVGEVYVVGVAPAYQGLGLGRAVTVLGLLHLRQRGLAEAMLYVDADNRPAVATYTRLDFSRASVDIMYSRPVASPV
jgi:mycothiol synthase